MISNGIFSNISEKNVVVIFVINDSVISICIIESIIGNG